jgi:hypothetical protein
MLIPNKRREKQVKAKVTKPVPTGQAGNLQYESYWVIESLGQ